MQDPYSILGVSRDASDEDIKKAYRKLSRIYHPDANINNPNKDQAEAKFKEIQQAYQQIMKEKEMGGIQLHFGGDQNFMAMIKCDGIPRFMLIDREGKFIDSNLTRPSEAATWKTLEALPGL